MKFIQTQTQLAEALSQIQNSSWAAVDTEADSLHHYLEKLCLVQISVEGEDFVIDPLVPLDLSDAGKILSDQFLILHGADFDIRMIKKNTGFFPKNIFDTMIAAQLLGYEKQGLADLVEKHCGLRLSKTEQRADWSRRPLDEKHLRYASNDTHYLRTVQTAMEKELVEQGRLDWLRESCEKLLLSLSEVGESKKDPERQWQIKGSKELRGLALTVLKALWHWREEIAKKRDVPPFKVLNSEYLIQIADWALKHPDGDIGEWGAAPRNVKREHREAINQILRDAKLMPQAFYVQKERKAKHRKWTESDSGRLTKLKEEREKIAVDYKINPSLLATNATLEELIAAAPKNREELENFKGLMRWQRAILSEAILKTTCQKN